MEEAPRATRGGLQRRMSLSCSTKAVGVKKAVPPMMISLLCCCITS